MNFPADLDSIRNRIKNIDPVTYSHTRNYTDGSISYLSPYISRGVISVNTIKNAVLEKYDASISQKFLQELAWREYWQRVWQHLGEKLHEDIKSQQQNVIHRNTIKNISAAATGIDAIDKYIRLLYKTGYMHNHLRMYVAGITCNIGGAHWLKPAAWMYYHLLDGDIASNQLSWQWIAGTFSSKKYYCNQENINKYTHDRQQKTFLDKPYDIIARMPVPDELKETAILQLDTSLPQTPLPVIDGTKPVLIYNSYNLDPAWRQDENADRILLLEPSHFKKFPVSNKVLEFIIALSGNIAGIQLFCGEINELTENCPTKNIISKEHPAFTHYPGKKDSRDWMFPYVQEYYPSFSAFWKKCERSTPC